MITRLIKIVPLLLLCMGSIGMAKSLKVGLASGVSTMDPHAFDETATNSILSNIFDPLVRFDANITIHPDLATSWSNPHPKVWILKLRKGVVFHNGSAFTADDVVYSFQRIKNWEKSGFKARVAMIESVQKVDDYTVKFITKKPFPTFLRKLTFVNILDKETTSSKSDAWIGLHPIGTGAYKFVFWRKGNLIRLKANPNYHLGKTFFDSVIFRVLSNNATRTAAILSGEVDLINRVSVVDVKRIQKNPQLHTFVKDGLRLIYLQMDQFRKTSPFLDVRVRKALYYGIDEDAIVKYIMKGFATPASEFHPSVVVGYDASIKRVSYDPKKAKQLLAEAGYPHGFSITLDAPNNRYINDAQIAQAIASSLAKIGISVHVNTMPKASFFPKTARQETSFFLIGWESSDGDGSSMLDSVIHSKDDKRGYGRYNNGKYANAEVDKLIEASDANMNPEKRLKEMQKAQYIALVQDQNIIPLHFQVDIYACSKKIHFTPRADGRIWVYDIK